MLRAFLRAPTGVFGLVLILVILVVAIFAPILLAEQATTTNVLNANAPPSAAYPLGTDTLGRDILARVLVATRLSIGLSLGAAVLGALIGMVLGGGAVVLHGWIRTAILRLIDALIAFPGILVAIFVGAIVGPGAVGVVIGVGISLSFSYARVTSALSLAIIDRDFVSAARITGIHRLRLLIRYILPNIAETLAITTSVAISTSIVAVSTLSFLGLGVQPPAFDWGTMLTQGIEAIYITPAAALGPAVAIAFSALAFGLTGEAVARAMNPVLWAGRSTPQSRTLGPAGEVSWTYPDSAIAVPQRGEAVLEVDKLSVSFPGSAGRFTVVDEVSFWLREGERLGIVGESGSGKTTLALGIAQLVAYPGQATGSVRLLGKELLAKSSIDKGLRKFMGLHLAVVYQDPLSSLNPALKIGRQLTEASRIHRGASKEQAKSEALQRLREVNIPAPTAQFERYPHSLSGGMRQRVMIAMGLMMDPAVFICDEPTTALDVTVQAQIMDLLERLNTDHDSAIVLVSHNLALVSQNTDRVLVMYAGRIVEDLSAAQLLDGGAHPYTRELLAAIPDTSRPRDELLGFIPGQAPDPADLPPGCAFEPRCPLAFAKCRNHRPPLEVLDDGRRVACWAVVEGASAMVARPVREGVLEA